MKEDKVTSTLSTNMYYARNSSCPDSVKGRVVSFNVSVDGGAWNDTKGECEGYYLQNSSVLVKSGGCVFLLDKRETESLDEDVSLKKSSRIWDWITDNIPLADW